MASDHLSRFALMRLLAGEAEEERGSQERHLAACPACTAVLAELRAVQEAGEREAPPLELPRRRAAPWWAALALAGASATAALLFTVLPADHGVRMKGGGRVEFACKDGPRTWRCRSGEHVRAGTAVGIRVDLPAPMWMMLLGRDGTGLWRSYLPAGGDEAVPVEAGSRDPLGQSLVLDEAPGEERFVLVAAPRPFRREEIVPGSGSALRLPDGFQSAELVLQK